MKLNYTLEFRCRHCGDFEVEKQSEVKETHDCPKCHRSSKFTKGTVIRIPDERPKAVSKNQKRLIEDEPK